MSRAAEGRAAGRGAGSLANGSAGVELRPTRESDLPALAELFGERFGHAWEPEEWRWKYRDLPGEARSWIAVDRRAPGGRVVAHAGALCMEAQLAGAERVEESRRAPIWQLTDWMGSVAAGGLRPPLVTLGRRLLSDLPRPGDAPWIFGFPSERHLRLGERTFGYRPLPPVRPLAGDLAAAAGPAVPPARPGAVREVGDRCGDWAEAAWEACRLPGVRRSVAFLNWRYHARPGRYYRVYRLASTGGAAEGPDGVAVFAFVGRLARGAELWLPPGGRWEAALREVARDLVAAGLERWELWPPPAAIEKAGGGGGDLLRMLGLAPAGEPVPMGFRTGGGSKTAPCPAPADFHYAMGDYDAV